jgi:5'(3')-deoxyribonucleotidase
MSNRLGIDVDGCLADFNHPFIDRCVQVTGKDLFPPRPFDIPVWDYPQHYSYTADETSAVWENIKADPWFWYNLPTYPNTIQSLKAIARQRQLGDDVYFITSRPGLNAKDQTERWLFKHTWDIPLANGSPTVLISSHKGLCAQALDLTHYIDDRDKNALDVASMHWKGEPPTVKTYLLDRPWNRACDADAYGIRRVASISEMMENL